MDSMNGIFDSILKEKNDDLFFTEKKGKIYRFLLDSLEKPLLERVLRYSEGNKVRAARSWYEQEYTEGKAETLGDVELISGKKATPFAYSLIS